MPKVKISFSIVASSARELNGCDSSAEVEMRRPEGEGEDRKSTRLNSSHLVISYAVFCLKKQNPPEGVVPLLCRGNSESVAATRISTLHQIRQRHGSPDSDRIQTTIIESRGLGPCLPHV